MVSQDEEVLIYAGDASKVMQVDLLGGIFVGVTFMFSRWWSPTVIRFSNPMNLD